jgi:hypothetical protein
MQCDVLFQRPLPLRFPFFLLHSRSIYFASFHFTPHLFQQDAVRTPRRALDRSSRKGPGHSTALSSCDLVLINTKSTSSIAFDRVQPSYARLLSHVLFNRPISAFVALPSFRGIPRVGPFSPTLVPKLWPWERLDWERQINIYQVYCYFGGRDLPNSPNITCNHVVCLQLHLNVAPSHDKHGRCRCQQGVAHAFSLPHASTALIA